MFTATQTPEVALPPAGYSVAEVERVLRIPAKTGYRLIREHKLAAFVDSCGMLKVSPFELYSYMKQHEEK